MIIFVITESNWDHCNTWENIVGAYMDKQLAEYNCGLLEEANHDPDTNYYVGTLQVNEEKL